MDDAGMNSMEAESLMLAQMMEQQTTKKKKGLKKKRSFIHSFKVQNEAPTSAATLMKMSQIYTVKCASYGHAHSAV